MTSDDLMKKVLPEQREGGPNLLSLSAALGSAHLRVETRTADQANEKALAHKLLEDSMKTKAAEAVLVIQAELESQLRTADPHLVAVYYRLPDLKDAPFFLTESEKTSLWRVFSDAVSESFSGLVRVAIVKDRASAYNGHLKTYLPMR